jgi:hypothetical protein
VAELLAALVRLGHDPGGTWVAGLLAQLEARSALFDKMDHALLRGAWAELNSARARHKAKQQGAHKKARASGKQKKQEQPDAAEMAGPGSNTISAAILMQQASSPNGL